MADLPPYCDSSDDAGKSTTSRPRRVYVVGMIVALLVLLMVVLHLTGKGPAGLHGS